jgi:hypothetical protein
MSFKQSYKKEYLIIAMSKELGIKEDILKNAFDRWMHEYSTQNPHIIEEIKDEDTTSISDGITSRISNEVESPIGKDAVRESRGKRVGRPGKLSSKIEA